MHSSNSGRNSENQGHQNQYNGEGDPEGDRGIMGGLAGGAAGAYGGHALGGKSGHGTSGTIIGALAGAFAGHKTQDGISDWRDERHDKKEEEKKQHEQQQHQQQQQQHHSSDAHSGRHQGDFGGNFSASSRDVRLDAHGDFNLHAQCQRTDGSFSSSTISLNRYLENDNGSFRWSSGSSNGASTYTVQQGDTLRAIAGRFAHCSYEDLARHNNIDNPDMIYPGQNLQVPGGGSRGGGNFGASARNVRLADGGQRLEAELESGGQWHTRSIILDERIGNRDGCLEFV
jgi:LysM repeat protein